jgi:hypothetical protein
MKGDWKAEVKDMGFERYPQLEKSGKQQFKFLDEGNVVQARTTGYREDSVVFTIEQSGQKKELWMSKMHPILRKLAEKGNLTGHTVTMEFSGSGLDMRAEIAEYR